MNNLITGYYWTYKRGSVGKVLRGRLDDADGPFEITGALTVTATKPRADAPTIDEAACTPDADQVNNKGEFKFTLDSTTANIPDGTYNIEFKHTAGGNVSFWPDDANDSRSFGKLKVTAALS